MLHVQRRTRLPSNPDPDSAAGRSLHRVLVPSQAKLPPMPRKSKSEHVQLRIYLTYLPSAKAHSTRIAQIVALAGTFDRIVLLLRSRDDTVEGRLPENVVCDCLFGTGEKVSRAGVLRRLLRHVRHHWRATGRDGLLIVDDWFRFLSPLFPLLRIERRLRHGRLLLVFSPVTSSLLWFMGNPWKTIRFCADFSYHRAFMCPWELLALYTADHVSVQSHGLANAYARLLSAKRITVTPNAIDPPPDPPEQPRLPAPPFRLLYVGNFSYNKGLDMLLALARPDLRPRYELLLVGRAYRREGAEILERLKKAGIRTMDWQSRTSLESLYAERDILLLPSRHEGMPRVVTEFLRMGKPVVASEIPGLSDITSPLLQSFPVGNQDGFEEALHRAASLLPVSPSMAQANLGSLAALSIEKTATCKAESLLRAAGALAPC